MDPIEQDVYELIGLDSKIKDLLYGFMDNRAGTIPEGFDDEPFNRFSIISSLTFFSEPNIIFSVARHSSDELLKKLEKVEESVRKTGEYVKLITKDITEVAGVDYNTYLSRYIQSAEDQVSDINELIRTIQYHIYEVGAVPNKKVESLIEEIDALVSPALKNKPLTSYVKTIQETQVIQENYDDLEKLVGSIDTQKKNIISLVDDFNKNKQNYLIQINSINYIKKLMDKLSTGLQESGLSLPEVFLKWSGESLASTIILADSIKKTTFDKENRHYESYLASTRLLQNIEDFDLTNIKKALESIKVSSTYPYINERFNQAKKILEEEFYLIREKIGRIRNALALITAPQNNVLIKLFSILKYYGMDRPVELLKTASISEFFSLNPVTITYEGKIAEDLKDLIGSTSRTNLKGWISQLYYQSLSRNRQLSMMGFGA